MAKSITWLDSYTIGIDNIDLQHKDLFQLINKVIQCNEEINLQLSLTRLFIYAEEHFKAEEHLMRVIGYSHYKQHQKKHSLLIKELNKSFKEDLSDPIIKEKLNNMLTRWLLLHIISENFKIESFLQTNFPPQKLANQWYSTPEKNYNLRAINYLHCVN